MRKTCEACKRRLWFWQTLTELVQCHVWSEPIRVRAHIFCSQRCAQATHGLAETKRPHVAYVERYHYQRADFLADCLLDGLLEPGDTAKVQAVLSQKEQQ